MKYYLPNDDFYHFDDPDTKQCRRCFERRPKSEFNRQASRHDGLYTYCKKCFRTYRRELADKKRRGDCREIIKKATLGKRDRTVLKWAHRLIERLGGAEKAAEQLHTLIDPGNVDGQPRLAPELFHLLLRVMQYEREVQMEQQRGEIGGMTDGEVAAELRRIAKG